MFIPLDIFRENQQNKDIGIGDRRDAWLALLAFDEPERIIALIEKYPEFRKIYEEGYEICRNTERVMEMFSKELRELDKNTVQYMIDEMQDTIDAQKDMIDTQKDTIDAQKDTIDNQKEMIDEMQEKFDKAIKRAVKSFCDLNLPKEEIRMRVCSLYELTDEEVQKYLQ